MPSFLAYFVLSGEEYSCRAPKTVENGGKTPEFFWKTVIFLLPFWEDSGKIKIAKPLLSSGKNRE